MPVGWEGKTSQWYTGHHHSAERGANGKLRQALPQTLPKGQLDSFYLLHIKSGQAGFENPLSTSTVRKSVTGRRFIFFKAMSIFLLPLQNATASQDVEIFIRPSHQKRYFLSKQNPSEAPRVASSVFVLLKYVADVFLQRGPGQAET